MNRLFKLIFPILITVIIFSTFYFIKIRNNSDSPENTLQKSFDSSGARIVHSELYFWGRLSNKNKNMEKLKTITIDISNSLGVLNNSSYSNRIISNDSVDKIELSGVTEDDLSVSVSAQLGKDDGKEENFISISVAQDSSSKGLEQAKQLVVKACRKYGINTKLNSCLTGNFDGKLNYEQLNDITRRIFKETEARKVEGIRDGNLISVSAYSPFIQDSIQVNGSRVNLNLAIRYNTYEDKTYLWLGTPVISTEY